jgi:hypothetical protein
VTSNTIAFFGRVDIEVCLAKIEPLGSTFFGKESKENFNNSWGEAPSGSIRSAATKCKVAQTISSHTIIVMTGGTLAM